MSVKSNCFLDSVRRKSEECMGRLGLVSRIPVKAGDVFNFRKEYIRERQLVMLGEYEPKFVYGPACQQPPASIVRRAPLF
jgi:hypothetical protein